MSTTNVLPSRLSLLRAITACAAALGLLVVSAAAAEAIGPPKEVIEANTTTWACEDAAGLPPHHCINIRSQGNTGLLLVFPPDDRGPAESISFDPKSQHRPCPHDPDAVDGTWWSVSPDNQGPWVCHHKP